MTIPGEFGPSVPFKVVRIKHGERAHVEQQIATEIPFTILANDIEIVTLLCSPCNLRELTYGYLYTSAFISKPADILDYSLDTKRWVAAVTLAKAPDPKILEKRLYTSGCGKGVMYASLSEVSSKRPLQSELKITGDQILAMASWLQHCSSLYRETGAVHTAALSLLGELPEHHADDVGRHNAVDKVVGFALQSGLELSKAVLISSGRTSSEILHKAKRAGIAITISRGAPTHQTILRARDMGVTVVGFARGGGFTLYSHEVRISL